MFAPCTSEHATYAIESANLGGAQNRYGIDANSCERAGCKIATKVLARTGALRSSDLAQCVVKQAEHLA